MSSFIDANGAVQQVTLDVTMYREAATSGQTLPHYFNKKYPTNVQKYGTSFQQMMASEGIFVQPNRELGIRASTMDEILNGTSMQAGVVVKDGVPASRILFPAVFLLAIEDRLNANLTMTADAFDEMIAIDESVAGDRYEQPLLNFTNPSAQMSQGIAQLAAPASMLTITSKDVAYRIPTFSIGLEISDQALKASTLDIVALSLARQAAVQRNVRAQGYLSALYNGDPDNLLGAGDGPLPVDTSTSFDPAATGGVMTQTAWMLYLLKNGTKRTLTHLVMDIKTAMAIEKRTGKPTIFGDNPNSPRIDTQFVLMNPTWAVNPKIFLTQDPAWTPGAVMGLDQKWAIRRVRNLTADYAAIENLVMRRSQSMRFDFGEHVNRLFSDAYGCMQVL